MFPDIVLKQKRADMMRAYAHPWVFSNGLVEQPNLQAGTLVRVLAQAGNQLGWAMYHPQNTIALRMVGFDESPLSPNWIAERIRAAHQMRQIGFQQMPTSYRLVHGENDLLPGLTIDVYEDSGVIQITSAGMDSLRSEIEAALIELGIHTIYEQSQSSARKIEGLAPRAGFWRGEKSFPMRISEGDILYDIDPEKDQKTGFFLDQRDARSWVRARKFQHVLDLFCNSGGFSIAAAKNGAQVLGLDSSAHALERMAHNIALNQLNSEQVTMEKQDVFRWLEHPKNGPYDLVILDPPSLAKSRKAQNQATRAYRKLNSQAASLVAPGGVLLTFSCSGLIAADTFHHSVFLGFRDSRRQGRVIQRFGPGPDHPEHLQFPEGRYFKGIAIVVD